MSPIRKPNLSLLRGIKSGEDSDYQTWVFAAAALSLLLIAAYSLVTVVEESRREQRIVEDVLMPAFSSIPDVQARKEAFFRFLTPYVEEANTQVLEDRTVILKLQTYYERNGELSDDRLVELNLLLELYDIDPVAKASSSTFQELLRRADTIPASLALAQAAIESAWGTSRFAREGNNLFGIWCYQPGCGMVPRRRPAGKTYEVAAYSSPRESFLAYMRNLNTNDSYSDLREIRFQYRVNGVEPSGYDLAAGLTQYSQERWTYVEKVRSLISYNRLERNS